MARDHFMAPTAPYAKSITTRLGAGSGSANYLSSLDLGKIVKIAGESRFDLAVAGDDIEGFLTSVELSPQNSFCIGGVRMPQIGDMVYANWDGLQANAGVSATVAIGDYVVAGTITAKGTALSAGNGYPKVVKATTPANSVYKWRVVSVPSTTNLTTLAVGTVMVIQRVA